MLHAALHCRVFRSLSACITPSFHHARFLVVALLPYFFRRFVFLLAQGFCREHWYFTNPLFGLAWEAGRRKEKGLPYIAGSWFAVWRTYAAGCEHNMDHPRAGDDIAFTGRRHFESARNSSRGLV